MQALFSIAPDGVANLLMVIDNGTRVKLLGNSAECYAVLSRTDDGRIAVVAIRSSTT
jgi:hypothetical protein